MTNAINASCEQETQLQELAKSIPTHYYKINPQFADQSREKLELEAHNALTQETKLSSHKILRASPISPKSQIDLSLIAIGATYLKEKKGLKNLYVCSTEKTFLEALANIKNTPGNVKAAFVFDDDFDDDEDDENDGISHVVTVCVEKVGSTLKIVYLDSLGDVDDTLEEKSNQFKELGEIEFYFSSIKRLTSDRDCMTFALRDAALFLENPHFFDQIKKVEISEGHKIYNITHLPPEMMKGTQSRPTLNTYLKTYSGNTQPLQQSLAKYIHSSNQTAEAKKRNYYMAERSTKYHYIALLAIQKLSTEELQRVIAKSLLVEEQKSPL